MAIRRGFKTIEAHDNHIIESWNSVVNKKDTVWVLGDLTMERSQPYKLLDELKGIKNVVLGNHDKPQHIQEMLKYINKVCGSFKYKDCILTHIPIHEREMKRYRLNVHGHLHSNGIGDARYVNVSCEQIDYKPVLLNKVINKEEKFSKSVHGLCPDCTFPIIQGDNYSGIKCSNSNCGYWFCY